MGLPLYKQIKRMFLIFPKKRKHITHLLFTDFGYKQL